jgi:glutamate/tyrosine decarboxylase-like PLP-dependent enzyme
VDSRICTQETDILGGSWISRLIAMQLESSRAALQTALDGALNYLENLDGGPVAPTLDRLALRNRLAKPLSDEGTSPQKVIEGLIADCAGGIVGSASGRFLGWAIGGTLPAAIAADWLVSTWDQNAALYSCGPAAAVVEEVVGSWLKELLNLPAEASFALTTGCQMAHVTCLAAARHALLAQIGWDVERKGLNASPSIRILANDRCHGSIERAARLLGFGTEAIADVPTNRDGCISADALEETFRSREPGSPVIVILQAGDFHTGAFDDFRVLIPIAKRHGAWVHVDGAFGLWAAVSPEYRQFTEALNTADSWAVDGHKWLNVPFDCGYAFVAKSDAHRSAISHRAPYLTHDVEARDQIDWNPEWSRRARGFPTYAALRQLGRDGVVDLINRCCSHAASLVSQIGRLPGAEILARPFINQGVIRFLDTRSHAREADHDRRTDEVIASVAASGEAFLTSSTWRGRRVMRVSVCNWRTNDADVSRTVSTFRKILESAQATEENMSDEPGM